jgi:hypothetical protein
MLNAALDGKLDGVPWRRIRCSRRGAGRAPHVGRQATGAATDLGRRFNENFARFDAIDRDVMAAAPRS